MTALEPFDYVQQDKSAVAQIKTEVRKTFLAGTILGLPRASYVVLD